MRRFARSLLCILLLLPVLTTAVFADTGPKPSVSIRIRGFHATAYFVTLLSEDDSTGPYSWVGFGELPEEPPTENADIWQAFVDYQDPDGYYFLQYFQQPETHEDRDGLYDSFSWDYYPPDRFKVLIYFPGTGEYLVSDEIVETYAFDSYFEVSPNPDGSGLEVERSYGYGWEIFAFLVRLLMTIGFEVIIALGFGYRTGKQLLVIIGTNFVTQLALNIGLLSGGYESWFLVYVLTYGFWELLIFAVEALIYKLLLEKVDEPYAQKKKPVMYALCANLTSFVMGYIISQWFPYVF